jgi:hypothetical protein
MRYNKPIVLLHNPYFGKTTNLLFREIITRNLDRIQIIDLSTMPSTSLAAAINDVPKTVSYALTENEKALINSHLKEHFRHLLQPAKKFKLYKLERAHRASTRPV